MLDVFYVAPFGPSRVGNCQKAGRCNIESVFFLSAIQEIKRSKIECERVEMTLGNGKPCKKCGTSDWYDSGHCKKCNKERIRKWQSENRDIMLRNTKRWKSENREKYNTYQKSYKENNPDKNREYSRKWRKNNPERSRELTNTWHRNNPEKCRTIRNRRRTAKTKAGGSYTSYEWEALCKQYDYYCLKCRKEFPYKELTADHVLPVSMGGSSSIENIQPLCFSCNSSKGAKHIDYRNKRGLLRWIQRKLF
jgi:5-methylcytosine-specific restriction endonuclease McrA